MSDLDVVFQAEKDAIVVVGLLAHVDRYFDEQVMYPPNPVPSHTNGLNIHACVIDNADGEVLGLEQNMIHATEYPWEHAEQRALRTAGARVIVKRPRPKDMSVEDYYVNLMFTAPGTDFLRSGSTCYTTLEPCPMCAATLLVARMKRVGYILKDTKYGGAWPNLKNQYYASSESIYGVCTPGTPPTPSPFIDKVSALQTMLLARADHLRSQGTRDTLLLDYCTDLLSSATAILRASTPQDLVTEGDDRARNMRTLQDMQRLCSVDTG